jgi:K+/H+ antiporter YhaU regulatory subunit KhtT
MYPFELKIPKNSHIIGKTIGNTSFWQNTKATILGIKRNDKLIISPGPYLDFREDDIILFVGTNEVLQNVENFINL